MIFLFFPQNFIPLNTNTFERILFQMFLFCLFLLFWILQLVNYCFFIGVSFSQSLKMYTDIPISKVNHPTKTFYVMIVSSMKII